MQNTLISQDVVRTSSSTPRWLAVALALGLSACDDGSGGGGGGGGSVADEQEGDGSKRPLFPSGTNDLQAVPHPQAIGFDFDNGNAAIEVVIPTVVPSI